MPTDLRDLYAALSADTDATVLDPAASVRRRGDRHTRTVAVAACVGAALAAGGIAVAASGAFNGGKGPAPADSPSPDSSSSPSPLPSPSVSPSPSLQAIVPPANAPIPDSAFFTPPANRTHAQPAKPTNGRYNRDSLCGATYPSDARIGRERHHQIYFYDVDVSADYVPLGTLDHTISVYEPGGAAAAMDEIRAAVAACPSDTGDNGVKLKYQLLTPKSLGDDAILVEQTWTPPPSDQPPYPVTTKQLISIVRIGDVITTLYVLGWEDIDADRSVTDDYTDRAVRAVEKWRK